MADRTHSHQSSGIDERTDERKTTVQTGKGASRGVTVITVIVLVLLAVLAFMYLTGGDFFANQADIDVVAPEDDVGGGQEQPQERPEGGSNSEFDGSSLGRFL